MAKGSWNKRKHLIPQAHQAMDTFKYEIAGELGLPVNNSTGEDYWGNLTSRECGSVGGSMVRRMIAMAQQQMAGGATTMGNSSMNTTGTGTMGNTYSNTQTSGTYGTYGNQHSTGTTTNTTGQQGQMSGQMSGQMTNGTQNSTSGSSGNGSSY